MLLTAVSTVLVGCSAATTGGPSTAPSTTPTARDTAASATVAFGEAPERADAPACSALLPADLVDALVPGATITDPLASAAHASGAWAAVEVAGGTSCRASTGASELDDVVPGVLHDPTYEGVSVSVLPRAAAAFDAASTALAQLRGGAGGAECVATVPARVSCDASVLAQNAWVTIAVTRRSDTGATPEALLPVHRELVERVRTAVAASAAGTQTGDDSPDGSFTTCSPDDVNAVAAEPLRWLSAQTDALPWLAEFAQTRAGAASCVFVAGSDLVAPDAVSTSTPRAGWFVEQRLAAGLVDRADRIELPGLGARDGAWRTCDDTACSIDIVHDETWTQYFLQRRVAPDTSAAVTRWAESSFSG